MDERALSNGRRRLLRILLAAPFVFAAGVRLRWLDEFAAADTLLAAASPGEKGASSRRVARPTPECGDDDEPTPPETEGPFFKPRSPQRASLIEPGLAGTRVVLEGRVFSHECKPVAGALLDFWHADDDGEYDNVGFRLRGHQFADAEGRFRLETIVPGLYPGRTRHYHVKVQAPHGRVLTTQLYFPGEPRNRRDGLYRPDLLMSMSDAQDTRRARFNFVLDLG
jgi:protocatechuate 3,4-dioxygenase beta subunit